MKRQAEKSFIVEKLVPAWASMCKFKLVEYVLNTHGHIPANEAGVGRHLEFVGNVVVQHFEARFVYVLVRCEIGHVSFKEMLGNFDCHWRSKGWQGRYIARVIWDLEGDNFNQCIHHWVHDESSPSMDGTLWT